MKKKTTEVLEDENRKWFITINNYTDDDIIRARNEIQKCRYGIFGREIGEKNHIPHIHIWLHYKSTRKWGKFSKMFPRANIQVGRGRDQDQIYIKKDNKFEEYGTPEKQGERSDLKKIKECVELGGNMNDILEIAENYQGIKMGEIILKYKEKKRDINPNLEVIWYYGKSGTGKTRKVFEENENVFCPTTYKWWDGYDGEEIVLLDDWRPDWCSYKQLLGLTDIYPFRVETKGGSRQVKYKRIYITSHLAPKDYYYGLDDDDYYQLERRITELREF